MFILLLSNHDFVDLKISNGPHSHVVRGEREILSGSALLLSRVDDILDIMRHLKL